jgi:hypothetical protein
MWYYYYPDILTALLVWSTACNLISQYLKVVTCKIILFGFSNLTEKWVFNYCQWFGSAYLYPYVLILTWTAAFPLLIKTTFKNPVMVISYFVAKVDISQYASESQILKESQ